MPSIETLLTFSLAAFLLSISPGPSNLYVMARGIAQGTGAGVAAASGMAVGSFIYVFASALGLAALFAYSPVAYTILKLAGAGYLIYLGYSYLRSKPETAEQSTLPKQSTGRIFRQSIIVELTNPKTALFFLAFFPQFVSPEAGNATLQFIVLGTMYAFIALACDLFVATSSGKLGTWMAQNPNLLRWQDKFSGSVLMAIGGFIAYEEL